MAISLNEFYACICIIFVLALYSVPPLLLNPALSGYERIKALAEQTGGAVFSALAGGSLFSTNTESAVVTGNVRVNNSDFLH